MPYEPPTLTGKIHYDALRAIRDLSQFANTLEQQVTILGQSAAGLAAIPPLATDLSDLTSIVNTLQREFHALDLSTVRNVTTLIDNRLVVGAGDTDISILGSLGTATTVLHGNAAGVPSFGAVVLTTDVSGTLPVPNGGTGAATFTSNGVLYGQGAGALAVTAQGAANTVLTANAGAPAFSATPTVTTLTTTGIVNAGTQVRVAGSVSARPFSVIAAGSANTEIFDLLQAALADGNVLYGLYGRSAAAAECGLIGYQYDSTPADSCCFLVNYGDNHITGGLTLRVGGALGLGVLATSQLHTTGTVRFQNFGAGAATFDASGNVSSVSDERLKVIQGPFAASLAELLPITPIRYKYARDTGLDQVNVYTGFSAQNVMQFIPEAVGKDPDGFYTLNDRAILAALVNGVRELTNEVTELRAVTLLPPRNYTRVPIVGDAGVVISPVRPPKVITPPLLPPGVTRV